MPSMRIIGVVLPSELMPRSVIEAAVPGWPDDCWMFAPAIFPDSADSTVKAGAAVSFSASTDSTLMPSRFRGRLRPRYDDLFQVQEVLGQLKVLRLLARLQRNRTSGARIANEAGQQGCFLAIGLALGHGDGVAPVRIRRCADNELFDQHVGIDQGLAAVVGDQAGDGGLLGEAEGWGKQHEAAGEAA